jgi:hypothetical protein
MYTFPPKYLISALFVRIRGPGSEFLRPWLGNGSLTGVSPASRFGVIAGGVYYLKSSLRSPLHLRL